MGQIIEAPLPHKGLLLNEPIHSKLETDFMKALNKKSLLKMNSYEIPKFLNYFSHFICGLYYKHVMIINDDSSIVSKWSFKLIDDPSVVIYDHHRFIIQATGFSTKCKPLAWHYNGTMHFKKCKQLFGYQLLLLLRAVWWSKF